VISDIDADGSQEILGGGDDGRVYGWNADGSDVLGFPIGFEAPINAAIAVGDVDCDGDVDLIVPISDNGCKGQLVVIDSPFPFDPSATEWAMAHSLPTNDGVYMWHQLVPPALLIGCP